MTDSYTLSAINTPLRDGENNEIEASHLYRVRGNQFQATIAEIFQRHGADVRLLPVSAGSAGGGVFQRGLEHEVVGIQFTATTQVRVRQASDPDLTSIELDEIVIDVDCNLVHAGAAITLEQLNQALQSGLGESFKVLGADLTSYTYAQVGSTFMTGGMGPQRRYFSDSVERIALFKDNVVSLIDGDALVAYAGTYGWTGIVTAVSCRFCQLPENEIAFAMPVNNTPDALADLLEHLSEHTYLEIRDNALQTELGATDCILGIEHITADAMGPMLATNADTTIHRRARHLKEKCTLAGADGLVFINGRSNQDIENFLFGLVDDADSDHPTISGVALEHTEIFNVADEMRAVREAVPAAARGQAPTGKYSFKGHTDANIRLDRKRTGDAMRTLWQANTRYVSAVNNCFANHPEVRGEILVYGHLNPYGVDPHNRITLASDSQEQCENIKQEIALHTHQFFRELDQLCATTESSFIGGEKGAGSEFEIIEAFDHIDQIPEEMRKKFEQQRIKIATTPEQFNWRAMPLYR